MVVKLASHKVKEKTSKLWLSDILSCRLLPFPLPNLIKNKTLLDSLHIEYLVITVTLFGKNRPRLNFRYPWLKHLHVWPQFVQRVVSHFPEDNAFMVCLALIHWIVIYRVDGAFHPTNFEQVAEASGFLSRLPFFYW